MKTEANKVRKVRVLRLRLRLPKTDCSLPDQIMEIPETGTSICPIIRLSGDENQKVKGSRTQGGVSSCGARIGPYHKER